MAWRLWFLTVSPWYLRTLFSATIVELVAVVIGWIKRDDIFVPSFNPDPSKYKANRDAKKLLATLYHHQLGFGFSTGANRWTARLPADRHTIPQFYRGAAELTAVGIIDLNPADNQIYLTNEGLRYAETHAANLADNERFLY